MRAGARVSGGVLQEDARNLIDKLGYEGSRMTIRSLIRLSAITLLLSYTMPGLACPDDSIDSIPFNEAHFASTHNSYCGNIDGERGAIIAQLDRGIRCIELDIHNDDFASHGYRIGHDEPGHGVYHDEGNPEDNRLSTWLQLIIDWSDKNPRHAPVTLYLDMKDDFGSSYKEGNLAHLNDDLLHAFGDRLFRSDALDSSGWPTVADLRSNVIVVLTGSTDNRLNYLRDRGFSPAVAMNALGQVIEVHDSGDGDLWYWTGQLEGGQVRWQRHGRYGSGKQPAIALNNDGAIVEIHEAFGPRAHTFRYIIGRLGSDLEIQWHPTAGNLFPDPIDGDRLTIAFPNLDSQTVRVTYKDPHSGTLNSREGEMDEHTVQISWHEPDGIIQARYDKSTASAGGDTLVISSDSYGPFEDNTLIYTVNRGKWHQIQYEQLAFVGFDDDMPDYALDLNPQFISADARNPEARQRAVSFLQSGRLVRLWRFSDGMYAPESPINFPATDFPFADWYVDYCKSIPCIK